MKNLCRIEPEPLSEQRWAKIERTLFERLEQGASGAAGLSERGGRTLGLRVALAAAALLGALAIFVFAGRGPLSPEVTVVDQPSRITTGASASHLALPGLALDVEPNSAVVVGAETQRGLLIVLDSGTIVCQVAARSSDAPLIVQAGGARVRVLGTRFSVTRRGETARVQVQQGVVEVDAAGRSFRVHAGEAWPAEPAQPPLPSTGLLTEATPEAVPAPSAEPPTEVWKDKAVATARPNSTPSSARRAPDSTAAPAAAPAKARPTRQAIFEQATAIERSDPERASQLYRTLESGGDSWAQNALYARARLEASRGNRGEGRRLVERYIERFPNGSNAEDARAVLRQIR